MGKVFIDDVWSGGKKSDGDYPLLSKAIAAGLYHPRCRDSHTTYFPGISTPPDDEYSEKEIKKADRKNKQEAQQQYADRQAKKFGRLANYLLDDENQKRYAARREEWKEKQSDEYYTGLTKIRVADKKEVFGAQFFATTQHQNSVGLKELILNPHKVSDYNKMVDRVEELSKNGYCVKIQDGKAGEYVDDVTKAEEKIRTLSKDKAFTDLSISAEKQMEAFKKLADAQNELKAIKISRYSMENADEFMAEAFADMRIGERPSAYSARVSEILDKNFGKRVVNSADSGIIKPGALKDKIQETNIKIDDLKQQFSVETDGYSYDEWFSEFDSIEDGFGGVTDGDVAQVAKLKDIDSQIRNASTQKYELLLQKDRRTQLDTGYTGRIPDNELDSFNKKALEQIKIDTGYSDVDAEQFQEGLLNYFGGDYEAILKGENGIDKIISDGIDRMPIYDGSIHRGMIMTNADAQQYVGLSPGDTLPTRGKFASWSSNNATATAYGGISDYKKSSIILECADNKTGVGVQHLSLFNDIEAEVLSNAKYEVVEVVTESKYDFMKKHKEYLYEPEHLESEAETLRREVVCRIKVKEIH